MRQVIEMKLDEAQGEAYRKYIVARAGYASALSNRLAMLEALNNLLTGDTRFGAGTRHEITGWSHQGKQMHVVQAGLQINYLDEPLINLRGVVVKGDGTPGKRVSSTTFKVVP